VQRRSRLLTTAAHSPDYQCRSPGEAFRPCRGRAWQANSTGEGLNTPGYFEAIPQVLAAQGIPIVCVTHDGAQAYRVAYPDSSCLVDA
jgi:hypothetical protein